MGSLLDRFDKISPLSRDFHGGEVGARFRRQEEAYNRSLRLLRRKARRGDVGSSLAEIKLRNQAEAEGIPTGGIRDADARLSNAQKADADQRRRASTLGQAAAIREQRNREELGALGVGAENREQGVRTGEGLSGGDAGRGLSGGAAGRGLVSGSQETRQRRLGQPAGGRLTNREVSDLRGPNAPGQPSTPGLDRQAAQGIGVDRVAATSPASGAQGVAGDVAGGIGAASRTLGGGGLLSRGVAQAASAVGSGTTTESDTTEPRRGLLSRVRDAAGEFFERGRRRRGERLLEEQNQQDLLDEGEARFQEELLKEGAENFDRSVANAPRAVVQQEVGPFQPFTAAANQTQRSGQLSREEGQSLPAQRRFFSNATRGVGRDVKSREFSGVKEVVQRAMRRGEINPRFAAQYLADVADVFKTYERLKAHGLAGAVPKPPAVSAMRKDPEALFNWVSAVNEQKLASDRG